LGPEHIKPISPARQKLRKIEDHQCPAYHPFIFASGTPGADTGLVVGIRGRSDAEYSRDLVALDASEADSLHWSPSGWCEKPKVELFSYDFILAPNGRVSPEDLSPSKVKLQPVPEGYVIHNVTGIRTHVVRRLEGKGYDVRKLGHYIVRPGQIIYINDSTLLQSLPTSNEEMVAENFGTIQLRFYVDAVDPMFNMLNMMEMVNDMELSVTGYVGFFGADLLEDTEELPLKLTGLIPVYRDDGNEFGCEPYDKSYQDGIILISRGECTFLEKLVEARNAGASGVVVVSDEDTAINPTADAGELVEAGNLDDVAIVILPRTAGQLVEQLLDTTQGIGQVMLSLEHEHQSAITDAGEVDHVPLKNDRVLYLNGHPLLNTRLLV